MNKTQRHQYWQLGRVGTVTIPGAILFACFGIAFSSSPSLAQITPDNTLGAESSVVTPVDQLNDRIDGGAARGANLFHSFEDFNIGEGRGVDFANPDGIENILSRVTGGNPSNIFGRLGVLGEANLFLINPNGIIFGPNSSLDVGASFLGTTANAVRLGDGGLFSASQPASSNLLTISPSAFWFREMIAQPIINQSQAASSIGQPNSLGGPPGLQVPAGETLGLVGGDVVLEGGNLTAAGGRIELGSVAGGGEVSLTQTGNRLVLGYDSVSELGNILLSDGALVDASGEGGGDIQIRGARLEVIEGSFIFANTLGTENGGEVVVGTTEEVILSEGSRLFATVLGSGTGGSLTIETGRLLVRDGARVSTITLDEGAGGNLRVLASDRVEVTGTNGRSPSRLGSESQGKGDAGEVTIETGHLLVSDGAFVSTDAFDEGTGGNLRVLASDRVEVTGTNDGFGSSLGSQSQGTGDAGEVTIETGQLIISDGAQVSTNTFNGGAGGNLRVLASDKVEVTGTNDESRSALGSQSGGKGDAGEVTIETGQLIISDGAQVSTDAFDEGAGGNLRVLASERVEVTGTNDESRSFLGSESQGKGDAGEVTIETGLLLISDGAFVSTSTNNEGAGGNLRVLASDRVEVTGTNNGLRSGLGSESAGKGDAGEVTIETGQLIISDGAFVSTSTNNEGAGGNLRVSASERVEVTGTNNGLRSGLGSESAGKGDAGEVTIETGQLIISDGAFVSTSTNNEGAGGNLRVSVSERVEVTGTNNGLRSGLGSESAGKGDAGEVTIETGQLLVSEGALVSTSTNNEGAGGNLRVLASERVEVTGTNDGFGSSLGSQSGGKGDAGEVTLETGHLLISDGALVSTSAFNEGAGGNLRVLASDKVEVTGTNNGLGSFLGSASVGQGDAGEVTIKTRQLLVSDGAAVSTSTANEGAGGKLTVLASDSVLLNNQGLLAALSLGTGNTGNIIITVNGLLSATDSNIDTSSSLSAGGAITIKAENIRLFGDSDITTSVLSGAGGGGNITVTADSVIAFDDSDILAFAQDGRGGDITFNTPAFFGENFQPAPPGTNPFTLDENDRVDINATGAVEGNIDLPDVTSIQNGITQITDNLINSDELIASSCIARTEQPDSTFYITGTGGFPERPGDAQTSIFPLGTIRNIPTNSDTPPSRTWQEGDPIIEPQGVYRLPNGELVLSRECPE